MKKLLLYIFIMININLTLNANIVNTRINSSFTTGSENVVELGKFKNLKHLDKIYDDRIKKDREQDLDYLYFNKEAEKSIIEVEYKYLNDDNITNKNYFKVAYVFKLAYEEDIVFGPKFYLINNSKDSILLIGLYGSYIINDNLKLYMNYLTKDSVLNKKDKYILNSTLDVRLKTDIDISNNFKFYSNFLLNFKSKSNDNSNKDSIDIDWGAKYKYDDFEYTLGFLTDEAIRISVGYKY